MTSTEAIDGRERLAKLGILVSLTALLWSLFGADMAADLVGQEQTYGPDAIPGLKLGAQWSPLVVGTLITAWCRLGGSDRAFPIAGFIIVVFGCACIGMGIWFLLGPDAGIGLGIVLLPLLGFSLAKAGIPFFVGEPAESEDWVRRAD